MLGADLPMLLLWGHPCSYLHPHLCFVSKPNNSNVSQVNFGEIAFWFELGP